MGVIIIGNVQLREERKKNETKSLITFNKFGFFVTFFGWPRRWINGLVNLIRTVFFHLSFSLSHFYQWFYFVILSSLIVTIIHLFIQTVRPFLISIYLFKLPFSVSMLNCSERTQIHIHTNHSDYDYNLWLLMTEKAKKKKMYTTYDHHVYNIH